MTRRIRGWEELVGVGGCFKEGFFFFFLKEGFKSERSTRWGKKFRVEEQTGRSVLLSGTGLQQMWAEGWGVRLGGMLGERREAGGGMSGQSPVVPLRIRGRHRRGHAQARLGFPKGRLAAVYRMDGGSCDTVRG